jgi:uncharacterized protein YndB with AHSA1/START domain
MLMATDRRELSAAAAVARPKLRIQRVLEAPRPLVWAAWTKPEMLVRWLGPVEWPAISAKQDLQVGGHWSACLQSATSSETLVQAGVFQEIVEPERLVFTFRWIGSHEDGEPVDTLVTVLLTELPNDRTLLDFAQEDLKSEESLSGHHHGWSSSFDRLTQWIAAQCHPVLERAR